MTHLGLNRTVGGGVVWRVICRTSDRETTPGPCNMHKTFAGVTFTQEFGSRFKFHRFGKGQGAGFGRFLSG
ncbi:BQ5605_C018g08722 [Microbotryum silenes-dioicae]|uniref:BQ5605_C018g08722 protein n=1 Tax=Microbotryum silenes-dioicae TaxID=796604 RepID=A0A2X0MIM5_9BASI|nr:BQ5605_C018g08722 [Microbotryum silenes-dioicae]